jgi:hypothetical protein
MAKTTLALRLAVIAAITTLAAAVVVAVAPRANAEAPQVLLYTTPT